MNFLCQKTEAHRLASDWPTYIQPAHRAFLLPIFSEGAQREEEARGGLDTGLSLKQQQTGQKMKANRGNNMAHETSVIYTSSKKKKNRKKVAFSHHDKAS